ncbi:HlyD family type I secretion periplasmic adaptor subunit [Lacisediminimonas profundi]|uniref:HlyD family type I secretion periplasmic adaptor subunit n=1 Tax=Lacisediminimonas profundi TaxID=2603856 RepID=UPI001F5013C4|nr:HlyD family type I secretion periplasmic adaptor subunit [Lacisediminimonas profundi]
MTKSPGPMPGMQPMQPIQPTHHIGAGARAFAPGLLAIQESPPSALPRAVLGSVAALVVLLLLWAIFGKLDVVASAEGRLVPQTYLKIVQPAEAGIVQQILVREGELVEAGQVLIRMDASIANADTRAIRSESALKRLQLRRIDAELAGQALTADGSDPPELFARVAAQQAAHVQAQGDALAQEQSVLDKTRHDLQAALELLRKLQEAIPVYQRSALAFARLGREGFYGALAVEEKQRELMEREQDLRAQTATVASLRATIAASEKRLSGIRSGYRSELHNERADIDARFRQLLEEGNKIDHKSGLLSLRAPQRGVIKDLSTHTPGTVVGPGTVLMSLIPSGDPLQAEVYVKNEDVGFVHREQRVRLKLSAYPFQKYGMLDGTVVHVGPDAADMAPASPAAPAGVTPKDADQAATGLRYKALVRLDRQDLPLEGKPLRLDAGMQVVAEIHQGRRTVMEYLLSPVQKAWQEAGRER